MRGHSSSYNKNCVHHTVIRESPENPLKNADLDDAIAKSGFFIYYFKNLQKPAKSLLTQNPITSYLLALRNLRFSIQKSEAERQHTYGQMGIVS